MTPRHPKPKTKALFMIQKITQLTGKRNMLGYSHCRPPGLETRESLPKPGIYANQNSPEGFLLHQLTVRKTPVTIYRSYEESRVWN